MTTHTLTAGQRGAYEKDLAANTVDSVVFPGRRAKMEITVISGSAPVYLTFDGTNPTDKGATCWPAYVGQSVQMPAGTSTVKLICRTAAVYSVNEVA